MRYIQPKITSTLNANIHHQERQDRAPIRSRQQPPDQWSCLPGRRVTGRYPPLETVQPLPDSREGLDFLSG